MMVTTEQVIRINKKYGGNLRSDSSLRFAESDSVATRSKDRELAVWLRAIIIDHPFSDGNKRTALYFVKKYKIIKNGEKMSRAIINIAKKNINDLYKIIQVIQNANR